MNTIRLFALCLLAVVAQGATAATIWLKNNTGEVCKNSASTNPGGLIGLGFVNRDSGLLTLTYSNPDTGTVSPPGECDKLPKTTNGPWGFSGNVTRHIVPVKMLKPGTGGALECQDQGLNFVGVNGEVGLPNTFYNFNFGFSKSVDDCATRTGLPDYNRQVSLRNLDAISEEQIDVFIGTYYIFNESAIPEPGSLLLMGIGAAGLVSILLLRRSRSHSSSP